MNNHHTARANLHRAQIILREAQRLYEQGIWNLVVRRAQEAVELALKGALWWAGLDVPRFHDVGSFLRENQQRFPEDFAPHIPQLAAISRSLSAERERSFYGDEVLRIPPEQIYSQHDATQALEQARFALEACRNLIEPTG
jgi:HEPN domain-containing protein